jgi:hypothetical protein
MYIEHGQEENKKGHDAQGTLKGSKELSRISCSTFVKKNVVLKRRTHGNRKAEGQDDTGHCGESVCMRCMRTWDYIDTHVAGWLFFSVDKKKTVWGRLEKIMTF